jgi:hypothetical protein
MLARGIELQLVALPLVGLLQVFLLVGDRPLLPVLVGRGLQLVVALLLLLLLVGGRSLMVLVVVGRGARVADGGCDVFGDIDAVASFDLRQVMLLVSRGMQQRMLLHVLMLVGGTPQ